MSDLLNGGKSNRGDDELKRQINKAYFMSGIDGKLVPALMVNEGLANLAQWVVCMSEHGYQFKPLTELEEEACRKIKCAGCHKVGQAASVLMFSEEPVKGSVVENLMMCHECGTVTDLIGGGTFWLQPFHKVNEMQVHSIGEEDKPLTEWEKATDELYRMLKSCLQHQPILMRPRVVRRVIEAEQALDCLVADLLDFEEWLQAER